MNTRAWKWIGASGLWTFALAVLAGACGGTTANTPSLGSESHFLARCEGSCAAGLDCIGGICTRACLTASSSCTDLSPGASCTDQSVEPGAVAVCDVGCSALGDCAQLGDGYSCVDSFCRTGDEPAGSTGMPQPAPGALSCESFADQSPPPDQRGFSIINRSPSVLYLQQVGGCGGDNSPSLVQILRDGQEVNVSGGGCGVSCQETLDVGLYRSATFPCGEGVCVGELTPDCPGIDCPAPARVAIQPGETVLQPARLETVFHGMPAGCMSPSPGNLVDTVNCYTKVIPARGSYTLAVTAYTEAGCVFPDCQPPIVFPVPSEWPYENHTIELTLP